MRQTTNKQQTNKHLLILLITICNCSYLRQVFSPHCSSAFIPHFNSFSSKFAGWDFTKLHGSAKFIISIFSNNSFFTPTHITYFPKWQENCWLLCQCMALTWPIHWSWIIVITSLFSLCGCSLLLVSSWFELDQFVTLWLVTSCLVTTSLHFRVSASLVPAPLLIPVTGGIPLSRMSWGRSRPNDAQHQGQQTHPKLRKELDTLQGVQ